ncbi:hypothetical protein [Rubripirellula reticaptiva]|uniref:Uncharacterized protein n=1 Tax=Rubripirellula reticaptiva TaxID=2528013 RepID=A0A5C6F220_9BACT|nr:hypothetical protein [Rubripirellula reticaptiva]TWU55145.1 hypothetical protein Poly59_14410 [Rubripirellula reticaptiva]
MQPPATQARSETLLWIGDRHSLDFANAYEFCESQSPQLAYRNNIQSALQRPAHDVGVIVLAQSQRQSPPDHLLRQLDAAHPNSSRLNLLGVLCEAITRSPLHGFDGVREPWHRWKEVLPELVGKGRDETAVAHSVLIVSSSIATAESLIDLACSADATAVWSRTPDAKGVRNIDAVWWDDSVAVPTSAHSWARRTLMIPSGNRTAKQAWLVNSPRPQDLSNAKSGGIDLVLSKPHRIEPLLQMLEDSQQKLDLSAPIKSVLNEPENALPKNRAA